MSLEHKSALDTSALNEAFTRAKAFLPGEVNEKLIMSDAEIHESVQKESETGGIFIDRQNLTIGMRRGPLERARKFVGEWEKIKSAFDTLIQPYILVIESVENFENEIAGVKESGKKQIEQIEKTVEASHSYSETKAGYLEKKDRYEKLKRLEGGREAITGAYALWYKPIMLMVASLEFFINYSTIMEFLGGVQALALCTTIALVLATCCSCHYLGMIVKQWSGRFGPDIPSRMRMNSWRTIGICSLLLCIVLAVAGGFRYELQLNAIRELGNSSDLNINPLREVLFSLLANIVVIACDFFVSHYAHDENHEYMEAAGHFLAVSKRYGRQRKKIEEDIATVEHATIKKVKQIEDALGDGKNKNEYKMWKELQQHDREVRSAALSATLHSLEVYKNVLIKEKSSSLTKDGGALTPSDYLRTDFDLSQEKYLFSQAA